MRWPTTIEPIWMGWSIAIRRLPVPPPTIKTCCVRSPRMAKHSSLHGKNSPNDPNRATPTVKKRSLHDDVKAALLTLGFPLPADALATALSVAEKESLSHLEFLHRLLAGPAEARRQRTIERRIRDARFRELTTLNGFDWAFNAKGVDRRAVEQLASCDFVRRRENVVLVGQTGLGKSRILQAVGHAACIMGYRVRYATSAKLLQESTAALADGSFAEMLEEYTRFDLLLIDEFGFDRLEREGRSQASNFYYRLLDARTGRRSTALATNIDFKDWGNYLGDPPLAAAFLDRLVHGAVVLRLSGRSYRAHGARSVVEAQAAD